MKEIKNNLSEEKIARIISVAYGDASFFERLLISFEALTDRKVDEILSEYKKSANKIHSIKIERCPERVEEKVYKIIDSSKGSASNFILRKPIIAFSSILIVSLLLLKSFSSHKYILERQYTEYELIEAKKEIELSLSIIKKAFNKTGQTIKEEVFAKQIKRPIKEGIFITNQLLKKEN